MRVLSLVTALALFPLAVWAQPERPSDAVLEALHLSQLLSVMQTEAIDSGVELVGSMDPQRDTSGWAKVISRINDPATLQPPMQEAFSQALPPEYLDAVLAYWRSPEGARIVTLEISAREAMLDPDVEDTVLSQFDGVAGEASHRADLLRQFIEVNNLIESNVSGTMNANAAFLRGLRQGAPNRGLGPLDDDAILSEVWDQEDEIRASTSDWLFAFVALAYQPMTDQELEDYIGFSQSDAGQAFNLALFEAFDRLFVATSTETGTALARFLASEAL